MATAGTVGCMVQGLQWEGRLPGNKNSPVNPSPNDRVSKENRQDLSFKSFKFTAYWLLWWPWSHESELPTKPCRKEQPVSVQFPSQSTLGSKPSLEQVLVQKALLQKNPRPCPGQHLRRGDLRPSSPTAIHGVMDAAVTQRPLWRVKLFSL